MKKIIPQFLRIALVSFAGSGALHAADLLSVDFNGASSPTQAGFAGQSATTFTHPTAAGNLTVTISGQQGNFDHPSTTGANTDFYRDFFFKNGGAMTLTLSGPAISANTDYGLTFWSYYGAEARNTSFSATAGTTGGTIGPIAASNAAPTGLGDARYTATGTFTSDGSRVLTISITGSGSRPAINGFRIATTGPDTTPPSLLPGNIVDNRSGAPVNENSMVTYTLTFSEDIDATTVSAEDFSNAGSSPVSFGTVTETSSGVFTVQVTPTAAGTLRLQVPAGATIKDAAGLDMVTTSAVADDTEITVTVAPADNTAPTPSPMAFAAPPYANSETSIAMVATTASDAAGVEYLFTETSGNPGGDSSNWQSSPAYVDAGLTTGMQYTYTVTARDLSSNQNATAASAEASATAQTPIVPPTITAPSSRHIVQRTAGNVGTIRITGTFSVGVPERVEARAVVMAGTGNNGTTTAWQTIDPAPSGGAFSGAHTNVAAGGWYQIEVRSVTGGTPSTAAVLEKVGVGDIYITAGQSNSANFAANEAPKDDRISARTSATASTWALATAPLPISNGTSGSVWTWLANRLIAAEDIPIGIVSLGVGGSTAASWTTGGGNYNARLKPAVKSFPTNGFRAALWHQGETDSVNGVPASTHSGYLNAMITQSRAEAGWNFPWYIAEASFHPSSSIPSQEAVAAGQRLTIHGDPGTFLGPSTDELHLTGGGSLHFNAVGTDAHARLWADILLGNVSPSPLNGDFETHGWLEYAAPNPTGPTPLADGASTTVNTAAAGGQIQRVLDWRVLAAGGATAADGSNGFHNPTTGTYAGAVDTANGGVLPNMVGKHVAFLDGGSAGNHFLQSVRATAAPNTSYTLTVALGVRDNPASFGNARLEITANGAVVSSKNFDKAALDTLRGGDTSGKFTDASVTWTTGGAVAGNQPLAYRIVKEGGTGTVLDFDNVRLTATPTNDFNSWISDPAYGLDPSDQGFALDPDGDGLANGVEAWFGTNPGESNPGIAVLSTIGGATVFTHPQNPSPIADVSGSYEWSPDLSNWYASTEGPVGGPTVALTPVTEGGITTTTATASVTFMSMFLRVAVSRN